MSDRQGVGTEDCQCPSELIGLVWIGHGAKSCRRRSWPGELDLCQLTSIGPAGTLVKCGCADHQRVKCEPYVQTMSAFYPRAMVTNEVHFPVYKPVDYTRNSSLSVCPGEAINSGHYTASTCSRLVHFLL